MKVIIRVQSPQLIRFLRLRQRPKIEKLPKFSLASRYSVGRHATPLTVWASSIVTLFACLSLVMFASLGSSSLSTLSGVDDSLARRISSSGQPEAPRPPEASFPYGSVPPLQSAQGPLTRESALPVPSTAAFGR